MLTIFTSLLVILTAALAAPLVAAVVPHKSVPEVVFLLVFGALLGPYGLGAVQVTEGVSTVSELGSGVPLSHCRLRGEPPRVCHESGAHCRRHLVREPGHRVRARCPYPARDPLEPARHRLGYSAHHHGLRHACSHPQGAWPYGDAHGPGCDGPRGVGRDISHLGGGPSALDARELAVVSYLDSVLFGGGRVGRRARSGTACRGPPLHGHREPARHHGADPRALCGGRSCWRW